MAHAQTVTPEASGASATNGTRARVPWQEPARSRRSKSLPAAGHPIAIAVAPAGDAARELRDLTSFVNRVLGWSTPAAHASGAA